MKSGIISSLIAEVIFLLLTFFWKFLEKRLALRFFKNYQRMTGIFRYPILIIWVISGIIIYIFFFNLWILIAHSIFGGLIIILYLIDRNNFDSVGIINVDKEIRKGIDYSKSLALCKNNLQFLGIGANKLTSTPEFEGAIRRCNPLEPIEILLCKPTDEALKEGAKRFGTEENEYRDKVVASLRKLARFKEQYKNINVRFYPHFQMFRLMFIDNSICLVSYNVLGSGDGSDLPQLHILNAPHGESQKLSFYYPLKAYFDELWANGDNWDYKQYII